MTAGRNEKDQTMNLQTKGAQSDHDEWDADKERMHGPSGNLVTISDGAGREVEMTSDELEGFESETGLTVAEDEVSPVRFDSLLAWLRESELLVEDAAKPAPDATHGDCPACAGERQGRAQHTPGPWSFTVSAESGGNPSAWNIIAPCGGVVAETGSGTDDANARLIAAAPELLAALQNILAANPDLAEVADEARAAIAKATGGAR